MRLNLSSRVSVGMLLLATIACSEAGNRPAAKVTVIDGTSAIIREIHVPAQLAQFDALWLDREPFAGDETPFWSLKLRIESSETEETWLYDPDGYARVLAAKQTPIYRIRRAADLRVLLGIVPAPQPRG